MHHKAEEEQTAKHGFAIEFNSPKKQPKNGRGKPNHHFKSEDTDR